MEDIIEENLNIEELEEENENIQEIEEDDDTVSLADYFTLCLDFEDDPTDKNSFAITEYLSKLRIKDFLSLQEKTIIATNITRSLIDELDATGAATSLEIGKVFQGLLAYVVNLRNDIGILNKTFITYDYCYIYGLVDTILKVCSKDYARLCSYIDNMINVSNAYRLIQTASILNDTEYNKWVNTLNDLKEKITPDMLKSLLSVDVMNNGGSDMQKLFGEMAAEQVNAGLKKDEDKYDKIAQDLDAKLGHLVAPEVDQNSVELTDEEK